MNLPILAQPLRLLSAFILCFWFAIAAFPAAAQNQAATTEATTDTQQALGQLVEVLRDDAAREALITELEANLPTEDVATPPEEAAPSTGEGLHSFGVQIADYTHDAVNRITGSLARFWLQLLNTPADFAALSAAEYGALGAMALNVAILVVVTYGALLIARRLISRPRRRLGTMFLSGGWVAKPVALLLELGLDILAALVPYGLGYVVAVTLLGEPGGVRLENTLYLNAFLMIEVALSVLRTVVSPNLPEQRLVRVSDGEARSIMAWSRNLVGLFVFGQMLFLPLVSAKVSFGAGRAIGLVLLLATLALAAMGVLAARNPVRDKLAHLLDRDGKRKGSEAVIAQWHIVALIYIGVLAIVALVGTSAQFQAYLWSNAQIGLAVLAGFIVLNVAKRLLGNGVSLPQGMESRSPELQRQLNAFAPVVLKVFRVLVVFAVAVACLHGLGLFNVLDFLESEFGARVAGATLTILVILGLAIVVWIALNAWVDGQINPALAPGATARKRTLFVLIRNALTIAIILVTLMFVLAEMGMNIAPLIASAGVIGLAIGFGAQKLVQDIINGMFIQFEGAIDVGDIITVGGITGEAERLTIRSVAVRDLEGSYHIVPFSSVDTVTNYMRGFSFALIHMAVSYREDAEYVKKAMFDAFEILRADPDYKNFIVADFEWSGVNEFGPSEVIFRARIKTLPGQQWGVRRAYLGIVKRVFDEHGIEIPYPHQTLYFGEDKAGNAPPVRIVSQQADEATQGQGTAPVAVRQTDEGIEIPDNVVQPASAKNNPVRKRRPAKRSQMPDSGQVGES